MRVFSTTRCPHVSHSILTTFTCSGMQDNTIRLQSANSSVPIRPRVKLGRQTYDPLARGGGEGSIPAVEPYFADLFLKQNSCIFQRIQFDRHNNKRKKNNIVCHSYASLPHKIRLLFPNHTGGTPCRRVANPPARAHPPRATRDRANLNK